MRKRVTITQVAKAAGVSPAAVSFAFNNPQQLGAETAERVRTVARDLGYAPNPIARAMTSRRIGAIGLLVPFNISATFSNPFIPVFMQGVGSVCDARSLSVLLVSPYEGSLEKALHRAPVDAYIILGLNEMHAEIEPLRRRQMPFVIVDGDAETVSSVNVDDEMGAYEAAAYLLAKGHRDILVQTFYSAAPSHKGEDVFYGVGGRRLTGYQRAFEECGLNLDVERFVQSPTDIGGAAEAFLQAWQAGARPTAVLAMSDAKAIGVMAAAKQLNLRVPEDLEIIGFDDLPLAQMVQPALSTVHQPIYEKGQRAAELLMEDLEETHPPENVLFETRLVLRETTRKP